MISSCWCCWTAAARKLWSRNYHKLPLCVRKGLKVAINSSDGTLNFIHLRCRPSLTNLPFSLHPSIISWGRHTQDFQLLIFFSALNFKSPTALSARQIECKGFENGIEKLHWNYPQDVLHIFSSIFSGLIQYINRVISPSAGQHEHIPASTAKLSIFFCFARQNFYFRIGQNPALNPE